MDRRNISLALFGAAASATLASKRADAQSCTAPCYAQTASEITAGVTPTNTSYPPGNVLRYGADPTGVNPSATAINNCLKVCGISGGRCYIPGGTYSVAADLSVPLGVQFLNASPFAVDIQGDGCDQTIIKFTNSVVHGLYYNGSGSAKLCGAVRDIQLHGNGVAPQLLTYVNCDMPLAERIIFRGATGRAVYYNVTIMSLLRHCYFSACGSPSFGAVEADTVTTFHWDRNYISSGNSGCVAGVRIDRTQGAYLIGGAIESTGVPVQIGAKSEAVTPCVSGKIVGMDFENPSDHYLDFGYGLSGSASVQAWSISECSGYPSGAVSVPIAIKMNRCIGMTFDNNQWAQQGTTTATYWLEGNSNGAIVIRPHPTLSGIAIPWVKQNGTQILWAGPLVEFNSSESPSRGLNSQVTISGSTASILVNASQGGYYEQGLINNSSATTMTALTGGIRGQRLELLDVNGNTALTNSAITPNQWLIKTGANLAMVRNVWYSFVHNGIGWVQL